MYVFSPDEGCLRPKHAHHRLVVSVMGGPGGAWLASAQSCKAKLMGVVAGASVFTTKLSSAKPDVGT